MISPPPSAPMRHARRWILSLLIVVLWAAHGSVLAEEDPVREVKDLPYGEVLFHFYQEDYFSAITHLLVARLLDRLPRHGDEAELLLGGLDLSYGLHNEAGAIFRALLEQHPEQSVRNRAWFYLAKIWYQRGYYAEADDALGRISESLPPQLQAERRLLHAYVHMGLGRFGDAIGVLERWKGPEDWSAYAQFNLGVALVRHGRADPGMELLDQVGTIRARDEEMRALRDKANLALGYTALQSDRAVEAHTYLQRVRLSGPYSNKALLGVGWALSELDQHENALVPWMELRGRDLMSPAVQESLLAIPYSFAKLEAYQQAVHHYQGAIDAFHRESVRLEESINDIRSGNLVHALLSEDDGRGMGWFWRLRELPQGPESRYLLHLLARHEFQEALKNFRDLSQLANNLDRWDTSVGAFDDMLATRRAAYAERLPRVQGVLEQLDLDALRARQQALTDRLRSIESSEATVALMNAQEQRLWSRLASIEKRLEKLPRRTEATEARDRHRLLKGVLRWQIEKGYKERVWAIRKGLNELGQAIDSTEAQRASLQHAQHQAPLRFEGYDNRIAELRSRLDTLRSQTAAAIAKQDRYLQHLAIKELERQRERLASYALQARFALARVYDEAGSVAETTQ